MATSFPSGLDSFTNPTAVDTLDSPPHDTQHADANDAIEAIETALLDGAPLHIDDANERVGVGNVSPSYKLDVTGDINASGQFRIGGTAVGEAVAFTPTWTAGLTVGNATENWYYYEINDLVVITGATVFGSTTALSTNPAMTLPVTAASDALNTSIGKGSSHDAGTAQYPNFWILQSTTSVTCYHMNAASTFVTTGSVNATIPFTWTTNDKIGGNIIYRRA